MGKLGFLCANGPHVRIILTAGNVWSCLEISSAPHVGAWLLLGKYGLRYNAKDRYPSRTEWPKMSTMLLSQTRSLCLYLECGGRRVRVHKHQKQP